MSGLETAVAAVSGDRLMAHLETFARWTKHAGTAGERASLDYVRGALDGFGYATTLIEHDAFISLPGRARIVAGGEEWRCITQSFSRASPAGGLTAPAIYLGAGGEADYLASEVRGKIVILDGIATPAAANRARAHGAVGQIHVSPHEHIHEMCISPVWGSPSHQTLGLLPTTVVVTTDKASGEALKALAAAPDARLTLHAEVDTGWRTTPILVAELASPSGAPDEPFVLFSGHHDTWYYGIMDNGGANATMIEVARVAAQHREHWRRGLRLIFWSGHSQGRYSSSTWYAETHWEDLATRAVAHVNIDSTGARGNTVLSDVQASPEMVGLGRSVIAERTGQQMTGFRVARAGDQSFWGIGVPSLFSALGEQPAEGGSAVASFLFGGPGRKGAGTGWWWHTPDDTLDKMDREIAVRDTQIYLHAIWRLLCDAVLPIDYAAQADALLARLGELESALGSRIDLSLLVARAVRLREGCIALRAQAAEAQGAAADDINRRIMALARLMVPLDCTGADRFGQDPALAMPPYPALAVLDDLAATAPGSDAQKAVAVEVRRAINRVAWTLRQANEVLNAPAISGDLP